MMFVGGLREKARVGFDSWLQQETDSERICCVTGPLGSGKTTLAAEFCGVEPDGEGTRDVKRQKRECEEEDRLITAFYFFQGDENLALNKCWAKVGRQLAGRLGYDLVGGVSTEEDSLFVFRRFVAEPLTRLSKPSNKIVILVDGVDKLPWEEQESFWEIVSQTWERETPMWVHLAVFSYTALRLSGTIRWVDLQDEDHEKDIELLCNARLASFMQDEEDVQYATKHIVRHSTERPSVLLYTSCVLDALLEGRSHRSVTLDDIWEMEWRPDCSAHAFRPYLIHFLDHVMDGDIDRYHQLLSCLSAARTPLSIDVAAEALEMNKESLKALVSRSTSLVYQEGDVIKFAHPCLKDVVQHRRCGKHPDGSPLQVKARRGHEWFVHFLEHNKTSSLALHDLIYHLCCARKWDAVRDHLLDFDWVLALVSEEGCALKLIEDADKLYNDKPHADVNATDVVRAIDLGLEAILADSALLKQQIIGRIPDETHPIRRSYEASLFAQTARAKRVFLPITQTILLARSSFRKRLRVDGEVVNDVKVHDAGRFVVLTLKSYESFIWDTLYNQFTRASSFISKSPIKGYCTVLGGEQPTSYTCYDWRFDKTLFRTEEFLHVSSPTLGGGDTFACHAFHGTEETHDDDIVCEIRVYSMKTNRCLQAIDVSFIQRVLGLEIQEDLILALAEERGHGDDKWNFFCKGKLWNFRTGELLITIHVGPERYYVKEWAFSGYRLHVNGRVWNTRNGDLELELPSGTRHVDLVQKYYWREGVIRKLDSGTPVAYVWIRKLFFLPDGFVSMRYKTCDLHNYGVSEALQIACKWPSQWHSPFASLRLFFLDDQVILSGSGLVAKLWKTRTGEVLQTYDCSTRASNEKNSIEAAAISHKFVACLVLDTTSTISETFSCFVWDRLQGTYLGTIRVEEPLYRVIGFFQNRIVVVAIDIVCHGPSHESRRQGKIKELHPLTGDILDEFPVPFANLNQILPGRLVCNTENSIFEYAKGNFIREFEDINFHSVFNDDFLITTNKEHVSILNWRSGARLPAWAGFASVGKSLLCVWDEEASQSIELEAIPGPFLFDYKFSISRPLFHAKGDVVYIAYEGDGENLSISMLSKT